MKLKRKRYLGGFNRFRLLITLGLAVVLPAAALVFVNYRQLRTLERDRIVQAAFHRDFQDYLASTEKKINKKAYAMAEEARDLFPSPDVGAQEKERKLDLVLAKSPWLAHVFLLDEKGFIFRSQPDRMSDKYFRAEHEHLAEMYHGWFTMEGHGMLMEIHKNPRAINFYAGRTKRSDGDAFLSTAMFVVPQLASDRLVVGGATLDACYLKQTFFPGLLQETANEKLNEQGGNQLTMMIYLADPDMGHEIKPLSASGGWGDGKPEVSRKFEDVFRGSALGIKFQGTSIEAIGQTWVHRSMLTLGFLSLVIVGGLVLTRHVVSKEMALARLKSDFVSNVSHELRTPLALIRLYAETLELGRISTKEKKQEYYRIIRKESERLTALINNILDFSRIEAGRKEYEFRPTDIADLVHNTLDSYRYQIEQQGFAFEESIDPDLPPVHIDREAIARALVNLVNNALKYSAEEKFLGVKLYRVNGSVRIEVVDHGIGITNREQSRIFEKFYRTGDPLVHNTKGSGLGLSLVRHITLAHGGQIDVESTPGKGSKFTLSLPLQTATAQPANATAM